MPVVAAAFEFALWAVQWPLLLARVSCVQWSKLWKITCPLVCFSQWRCAYAEKTLLSLMQMAASAALAKLQERGLPYICIDRPNHGWGVCKFSDVRGYNVAEPKALIGFTGATCYRTNCSRKVTTRFPTQ